MLHSPLSLSQLLYLSLFLSLSFSGANLHLVSPLTAELCFRSASFASAEIFFSQQLFFRSRRKKMRARSNFFPPTRCAAAAAAASREKWAATKSWLSGATEAHRPMVERARTRSFFQQSCFIFRQITATADVLECCCCCFGDDGGGEISS